MRHLRCNKSRDRLAGDVVYTPDHVAAEIVHRYRPSGRVLDPCAGDGAFLRHVPGCLWCEVAGAPGGGPGRDFFDWKEPVDWVVGNPPYSILNAWLAHSFTIAADVVYLLPVAKVFGSRKRLLMVKGYGGVVEVYAPWTGRAVGFPFGWACGAVHFRRGHAGPLRLVVERVTRDGELTP